MFDHDSNSQGGQWPATPSPTFERLIATLGLTRRARQDRAVTLAHQATELQRRVIIQAPTGVGKSFVALSTAADAGKPGAPGIVATTMNSLGDQYLRDCRRAAAAAGFTYTRVMGATHYACADSAAAKADGVPGYDELEKDADGDGDNRDRLREEREAWLHNLRSAAPDAIDPASCWELASLGVGAGHRCPGYPECAGGLLGGCGSKAARARSFGVDVVITNYHLLTYTHKLGLPLIPLADAAVVVIDEAHELPGKIAEITGAKLDEQTGSRVFRAHPALAKATQAWITASIDQAAWPHPASETKWDTEAEAKPETGPALQAFVDAWNSLSDAEKAVVEKDQATEDGGLGAGDVMSILRHFASTLQGSTWRAWTSRAPQTYGQYGRVETWSYAREIQLRQVDAGSVVIPDMLPPAAVLMSGTVGTTLPARLGLLDAQVDDLGQEFDWSKVRGRISQHSGIKASVPFEQRKVRDQARLQELARVTLSHAGSLVLANAAEDARFIAKQLERLLPGFRVFTPAGGGSIAAEQTKNQFIECRKRGGRAVLVGVDSYCTGLDLSGDLCTLVSWWVCVKSAAGYYDGQVDAFFSMHGSYLDERFRSKFAQGIGRLLRTPTDTGEVFVSDERARRYLTSRLTRVDAHLAEIAWSMAGAA